MIRGSALAAALLCAGLLAPGLACAPRRSGEGSAPGASAPRDTAGVALEQKLADLEVALGAFHAVHWHDRALEWDVREDHGRIYYVRQQFPESTAPTKRPPESAGGGSGSAHDSDSDAEYFYEDGRLFASRWRSATLGPGDAPPRDLVTVAFFGPAGQLLHVRTVVGGRVLVMDSRRREWWRGHTLELSGAALDDARRHLAAR